MLLITKVYKKYISSLAILFFACETAPSSLQVHQGRALGTSYTIQYKGKANQYAQYQKSIDSLFQRINQSLSTYWPDSDISKINRGDSLVVVDSHFQKVFRKATTVWKNTNGFFDPTVGSLANAYGFGPQKPLARIRVAQLDSLRKLTGWEKVSLTKNGTIRKDYPDIYLDFNAIAKGYTVDVIANYLSQKGQQNYLVEIGGEVVAKGISPKFQKAWTVAIDDPQQGAERRFKTTLSLVDEALATSGNYRKYRIDSLTGEKYVHSLNPHTGLPVKSSILSASVRAADCMTADAYATALMVLPLEEGQELIASATNLEAYWIVSQGSTTLEVTTKGW
jgi:thiamine biosynthesis lipoprotein